MAGFVQFLGFAAMMFAALFILLAFEQSGFNESGAMILFGVAGALVLNGALLMVFGQIGNDTRRLREIAEKHDMPSAQAKE